MTGWRIRDYHADDVDGILRLWEQMLAVNAEPVYGLSDVLASCAKDHAVVAVIGDEVVGAAIGRAAHAQGWVVFLATAAHVRGTGIGSSMLAALEARMAAVGISKLSALMPAAETRVGAFLHQGFALKQDLHYFERHIPVQREELKILAGAGRAGAPARAVGRRRRDDRREGSARATRGDAARTSRARGPVRRRAAARDRAVRSARNRQDHLREGDRLTPGVVVRRGLPVAPRVAPRRSRGGSARDVHEDLRARARRRVHRRGRGDRVAPAGRAALADAGRHERAAEDHPRVPRAAGPAADLRHELHQGAGCRFPPSRPFRLRHPDRAARRRGAAGDLGALHPCRGRRHRRATCWSR